MKTFAVKEKRAAPAIRRSQPSRFGYRGPEVTAQQAEIRRILRSTGVQAKLTIGQPNDKYEQEADRVAEQVMRMPEPRLQPVVGLGNPRRDPETAGQTYVVNKGDTLQGIAKAFGVTTKALVDMNRSKVQTWPTSTGKKIQGFNAGQTIIIPGAGAPEPTGESEESFVTSITQRIKSVGAAVRNKVKTFWDKATSFWSAGVSFWDKATDSLVGESDSLAEIEKTAEEEDNATSYKSQLDNEYREGGVEGKNMCNVTTLAMQLETVAGSADKAKSAVIDLLKKKGEATDEASLRKKQLEDLIMQRFKLMGDSGWKKRDGKKPFWKGWYDWAKNTLKSPWHQQALCLNYVATELSDLVGKTKHAEAGPKVKLETLLSSPYFKETLHPALQEGASVMLSTQLTGGHIVLLADVVNEGAVINDPYGMLVEKKSAYIPNGSQTKASRLNRIKKHHDLVKQRLKYNTGLFEKLQKPESLGKTFPDNMGERNFYPWDEVKKYKIGKWNNILYGKDETVSG